jgi:F-type H+-transporting ATPase subunit epsilon
MIDFKIVKPEGVVYADEIEKVTIPTQAGEITILPDHIPLVSVLATGEVLIYKHDASVISIAVSGGILEIRPDSKVYVMADTAERAEEIDLARAEEAHARAQELLKQEHNLADVDFARIQAVIEKELNRIGIKNKYKDVK